jgi:hypothetical protein
MGDMSSANQVIGKWESQWETTSSQLQKGFVWPIQKLAAFYAEHAADLIANPLTAAAQTEQKSTLLWDDWAQARFGDALDDFINTVDGLGLPTTPLKNQLVTTRNKAPKIVQSQTELLVREALAQPGSTLHRTFLKFIRFCEIVLPLLAIGWVGYLVFIGYYQSNATHDHYLGIDFAIHSSLLILISWLIPWFILKKLKPSLEKSALSGLTNGLDNAFNMINGEVLQIIKSVTEQHSGQLKQVRQISQECGLGDRYKSDTTDSSSPLARMLIN